MSDDNYDSEDHVNLDYHPDNNLDDNNLDEEDVELDEGEISAYLELQNQQKQAVLNSNFINDKAGLLRKYEEIVLGGIDKKVPWIETLSIGTAEPINIQNPQNDSERDNKFINIALLAVNDALSRLDDMQIPHRRPGDYFAEMVKSDIQMEKIRKSLLHEKTTIQKSEDRRKQRELKKFGKQVQTQKLKEREDKKKQDLEAIKKWRKKQREK